MIEWEYKDCRPEGFEFYEAKWGKFYSIAITKLSDTGIRYTVRWYYKGMTEIKEHIDAKNWDEAKSSAISIVRDYFDRQAKYWRDMKIGFANWTEVI
jgi:hypothetical protein